MRHALGTAEAFSEATTLYETSCDENPNDNITLRQRARVEGAESRPSRLSCSTVALVFARPIASAHSVAFLLPSIHSPLW
jgi:hypothetical protein